MVLTFHSQSQEQTVTMTTTFDATPFTAVPTGISVLPTGTYILPVNVPSASQRSCLVNSQQSNAWSCSIPPPPAPLQIVVTAIPGNNGLNNNQAVLTYGNNTLLSFAYGAQAPVISYPQVMKLVLDSEEPEKGPAWWFQLPYNKMVILRENDPATINSKREIVEERGWGAGDFMRKGVAQPGERPWFCYWNGTLLETFIYVNQTNAAGSQQASSSAAAALTATSTASGSTQASTGTYSSSVPTSNVQSQGSSYSGQSQIPYFPPSYPRVVKLEERRIPRGPQRISPYCVQQVVQPDGSTLPFLNSTGQPVTIHLNETQPTSYSRRDFFLQSIYERDAGDKCGCTWEWT